MRWSDLDNHDRFGFAELDDLGRIRRCTRSFATIVGTDRAGVMGETVLDLIDNRDDLQVRFEKMKSHGVDFASLRVVFLWGTTRTPCFMEVITMPRIEGEEGRKWAVICKDDSLGRDGSSALIDELEAKVESLVTELVDLAKLVASRDSHTTIHTTNINADDVNSVQAEKLDGDVNTKQ